MSLTSIGRKHLYKDGNNCIKSFVIKKKKDCPAGKLLMFLTYSLQIFKEISCNRLEVATFLPSNDEFTSFTYKL